MAEFEANFEISERETIEAQFIIYAQTATASWGSIVGILENQTDLKNALDAKMNASTKYGKALGLSNKVLSLKDQDGTTLNSVTLPDGGLVDDVKVNGTSVVTNKVANIDLTGKQDVINDLSTIRSNATHGESAYNTIAGYGNIVTHNVNEFATSEQGLLADTALQSGDNISNLTNNENYIKLTNLSATSPINYNSASGVISVASGYSIPTTAQTGAIDTALQPADITNNVTSTATNKALSANMGKELNDRINNIESRGRFLAVWNCTTGLPTTNPTVLPYTYRTGDYFVVGVVGTTNYKPTGSSYTGEASTTIETNTVDVNATYIYDGTTWNLYQGTVASVTFASLTGQPTDNTNLANALNLKVTANNAITGGTKCKITYDSKGLVTGGADITISDVSGITATANEINILDGAEITTTELNYLDGATSNIQNQLNKKQDVLTPTSPLSFTTKTIGGAVRYNITNDTATPLNTSYNISWDGNVHFSNGQSYSGQMTFDDFCSENTSYIEIPIDLSSLVGGAVKSFIIAGFPSSSFQYRMIFGNLTGNHFEPKVYFRGSDSQLQSQGAFEAGTISNLASWSTSSEATYQVSSEYNKESGSESSETNAYRWVQVNTYYNGGDHFNISFDIHHLDKVGSSLCWGTLSSSDLERINSVRIFYTSTLSASNTSYDNRSWVLATGSQQIIQAEVKYDNSTIKVNGSGKLYAESLNGLTASITELNYTDGVTSNIQTQLNSKLSSITSSDVTTALGYTPYNSTNPNGYQTSAQVSSAISAYHDSTKQDVATYDSVNERLVL